jgi:hypothetical protein
MPVIRIVGLLKLRTRSAQDFQEKRMKKLNGRASTLLLLGWCAGLTSTAAADERSSTNDPCRQETKCVVVWPPGPKAATMTRFERREVTVCDAKVSQRSGKGK